MKHIGIKKIDANRTRLIVCGNKITESQWIAQQLRDILDWKIVVQEYYKIYPYNISFLNKFFEIIKPNYFIYNPKIILTKKNDTKFYPNEILGMINILYLCSQNDVKFICIITQDQFKVECTISTTPIIYQHKLLSSFIQEHITKLYPKSLTIYTDNIQHQDTINTIVKYKDYFGAHKIQCQ